MNLKIVWIILGIVSFLLALYIFSFAYWDPGTKMYKKETRIPVYTLIVFIISIAAILLGGYVNSFASKYQNISYSEVRPSFVTTIQVGARSMTKNFVTGTGSNSFNDAWKLVKPQNISGTQYGSANFQLGFGTFPTFMALGGVIGLIVWLLFFGTIVWTGVKTVTRPFDHPMSRFFIVSLVLLILYLIIFGFVYIISISLMIILAILLGSFFGILRAYGYGDEIDLAFIKDPRTSFFGIIILVAIMLISIFGLYTIIRKFGSLNRFQTGSMELLQSASRDEGRVKLDQAIALSNNDIFHRQLASLAISDTQEFLNSDQAGQLSKDELKTTIQRLSFAAIGQANAAIAYNKNDAQNWIAQGDVYRFLTRTQIFSDAYDKAVESYTQAQHRNPKDATMDLYFAQLEIAHNNPEKARELITASINRQPTPDAYILKYQMDLADKNTDAAFSSLRQAINLDPYNVSFYYEYGLLTYGQKRYDEAAAAFNQVLILNRSYVQAYFYLAVSLERSGNTDQANRVIEFLHNSNENTDKILDQLRNADTVPTVPVAAVTTVTKPDPVAQTPKKQ